MLDVKEACDRIEASAKKRKREIKQKWSSLTTAELKEAQKEISKELARRKRA